jgi:hypothetical protein
MEERVPDHLAPGDWLDDEDRQAPHRTLDASVADVAAGLVVETSERPRLFRARSWRAAVTGRSPFPRDGQKSSHARPWRLGSGVPGIDGAT